MGRDWSKLTIEALVNGYGVDANITWLLDQREIYVALTSNPDGRALEELGLGAEPPNTGSPWYCRKNGNQAISAAELFLVRQGGATPGDPGTGMAMAASDGSFNSTVENVTATVSTSGLGRGRYVALVRGKDAGNNWGPFSAASFEVTCFFADLDCSGEVDVLDITLAAEGLIAAWQHGSYDTIYDVNDGGVGDGVIDIADVQILVSYFGQTAP
jgi:hypothetical protein